MDLIWSGSDADCCTDATNPEDDRTKIIRTYRIPIGEEDAEIEKIEEITAKEAREARSRNIDLEISPFSTRIRFARR
jgi:hypothetical protein